MILHLQPASIWYYDILWLFPDVSNAEAANIHAWIEFLAAVFGMYRLAALPSVDLKSLIVLLFGMFWNACTYTSKPKNFTAAVPHQETSGLHNLQWAVWLSQRHNGLINWTTITQCSASSLQRLHSFFFIGCPWSINEFHDCNSQGSCSRTRPYRSPRLLFICMSWSDSGKLGNLETPANHHLVML